MSPDNLCCDGKLGMRLHVYFLPKKFQYIVPPIFYHLFVGVQDDLDDLDMDDDNSDHMNDDQGSADHDTANFDLPAVSNSTKDDSVGCFRSHTGSVLVCIVIVNSMCI